MEELTKAREAIAATRGVVKSQIRSLRTVKSFLADLDERLEALEAATDNSHSQGGTANGNNRTEEALG